MAAYYNEIDPFAAQWLRNLIAAGHIAPGEVDTRSIEDVTSDDLKGFKQCHFFAGIGIWSRALRDAGWPDDRMAWTGSCPCQPFSAAGKGAGFTDERHLWPAWHHLIAERHPPVVFGEQVASALHWLDLVQTDMEAADYAFGANDLCAAGFSGAHIRQRLYFVGLADARCAANECSRRPGEAHAASGTAESQASQRERSGPADRSGGAAGGVADCSSFGQREGGECRSEAGSSGARQHGDAGGMADTVRGRARYDAGEGVGAQAAPDRVDRSVSGQRLRAGVEDSSGGLADDDDAGPQGRAGVPERGDELPAGAGGVEAEPRPAHAPMLGRHAVDWLYCRDAKWRPVEPGTFPLADAAPQRVGRLRAYGNGLDLETATSFVGAVMDALGSS